MVHDSVAHVNSMGGSVFVLLKLKTLLNNFYDQIRSEDLNNDIFFYYHFRIFKKVLLWVVLFIYFFEFLTHSFFPFTTHDISAFS